MVNITKKVLLLGLILSTAGIASASQWEISFSSGISDIVASTDTVWNASGYVELSTESVRLLYQESALIEEVQSGYHMELGYRFASYINGYVSKFFKYTKSNSTQNAQVHFWDDTGPSGDWYDCLSTATISSPLTGWQYAEIPPGDIPLKANYPYRISMYVESQYSISFADPTFKEVKHNNSNIAVFQYNINGIRRTPGPGYPGTAEISPGPIYGVPDCEITFYSDQGEFQTIVYDMGMSTPKYKSFISSSTIAPIESGEAVQPSIDLSFGLSDNPEGPFTYYEVSGADLTGLPNKRYVKIKTILNGSTNRNSPKLYGLNITYNRPPSTFTIISPVNEAITGNNNPDFEWNDSFDLDGDGFLYDLEISTYNGFENIHVSSYGISVTSISYTQISGATLEDKATYYWRICAIDNNEYSDRSAWLGPFVFYSDYSSAFKVKALVPPDDSRVFLSALLAADPGYYKIGVLYDKQFDQLTVNESEFSIENENGEELDFDFNVWVNSVTLHVSTSTVPSMEDSLMYTVTVSTSIKVEKMNKYLSAPYEFSFATLISTVSVVSFGGIGSGYGYELSIPAGASDRSLYVQRELVDEDSNDELRSANLNVNLNDMFKTIDNAAYEFSATDSDKADLAGFSVPVTLELYYGNDVFSEDYVYDITNPANPVIKTEQLKMSTIGDDGNWEIVETQLLSKPGKKITGYLNHLSVYSILAYTATDAVLSGLKNMPNPFDPNTQSTTIYYVLTKDSTVNIKIYNLIGDMVRAFDSEVCPGAGSASGIFNSIQWDGKNALGRVAADGCYLCYITASYEEGGKNYSMSRLLKIAVLK